MARLARTSRAQVQEIPDSYEYQQQELSINSSDVEPEEDDTQLIQHQLTQEQPAEDDEDDDDDGAVNLFLPDIVDIVNKAANTPSKPRAQASHRLSSLPRSSPIAAARHNSSPRSQLEITAAQGTQDTQSSTQSEELSHFNNYVRKTQQAKAQLLQPGKQKSSPLRRPSSSAKPLSRSATPNEVSFEGKPDPYEVPSSPEIERRPGPLQHHAVDKETAQPLAGGKRKRKEVAPVKRSVTPEEPVVSKRPRRGQDKPVYSPSSLRKVNKPQRREAVAQGEVEEAPLKRGRGRPKKVAEVKAEKKAAEEPVKQLEEGPGEGGKTVPVVILPLKRTRSRQAELEAEMPVPHAHQSRSLRDKSVDIPNAIIGSSSSRMANRKCAKCYAKASTHWHTSLAGEVPNGHHYCHNCHSKDAKKKKAHRSGTVEAVEAEQPVPQAPTGLDLLRSSPSTWAKSGKEKVVTQVPGTQSQDVAPLKSAYTAYREKHQQTAIDEEEQEAEAEASSPIPETPKQQKRAKSSSVAPQSASPRMLRKHRQHFREVPADQIREIVPTIAPKPLPEAENEQEVEGDEADDNGDAARTRRLAQRPKNAKERAAQKKLLKADEYARWQQEQEDSLAAEAEKLQRKKARAEKSRVAVAEKNSENSANNSRTTRSRNVNGGALELIEESVEPETADFNMDEVPESMFNGEEDVEILVEGDRPMTEFDEIQGQPAMDDENEYMEDEQDGQDDVEDEGEEEEQSGMEGISSILMNPSPRKIPAHKFAVPKKQAKALKQNLANQNNMKEASTSKRRTRSTWQPSPQPQDEVESRSLISSREESPLENPAEDSNTTVDYGRNPFDEPIFNFSEKQFSATSRCFLKNMMLDRDVRELFELTSDLQTTIGGVDRQTEHARDMAKLRRYLVGDYKSMKEQHDMEDGDESVICDLYANVFANTRKLHKKVNELIDDDLDADPEDLSNGEQATRNKGRKRLLRDLYLFIVPDLLKVVIAMVKTYCEDKPIGIYSFEELHGLVRLTLSLLRTGEDENNSPYRPKNSTGNIDYQYPKFKDLMKTLRKIEISCQTIVKEQAAYEKEKERVKQQRKQAKREELEKKLKHEAFLKELEERRREEEEQRAEEERIHREKLRAWAEANAHILQKYKDKPLPRQVTQLGFPSSQRSSRRGSVQDDPFAQDIKNVQPTTIGRQAQQTRPLVDRRSVESRRKPIVKAAGRQAPWAQNEQQLQHIVRPHTLPMSNDDSDDDAYGSPQEPRRKFVHHAVSLDEVDDAANEDEDVDQPLVPMDLDSEEEDLPEYPVGNGLLRRRVPEEELSLTQQRLNQEQRIKMLVSQLKDLEEDDPETRDALEKLEGKIRQKTAVLRGVVRKWRELKIRERAFYHGEEAEVDVRDEDVEDWDGDLDGLLDEVNIPKQREQYSDEDEEEEEYDDEEENDDESVEIGTSFPGNNNRMAPVRPWTREELSVLTTHLKVFSNKGKYIQAADTLGRGLDDVVRTAIEHKEAWMEKYIKEEGKCPRWVMCIGQEIA